MGGRGAHTSCYRFRCQVVTCLRSHAASDATFTADSQRGRSDSGDRTVVVDDDAPMFSRCCISAPQEHIRSRRSRRGSGSTTSGRNSNRSHAQSCSSSRRRIAARSRAFPRKKGGAPSSDSNRRWTICCGGCRSNLTRWRRRSLRHRQAAITPCCRRWIGSVVAIVATVAGLFGKAEAQYKTGTALYEDHMDIAEAELTATLKGGDYVEDVFYPERQYEDRDTYVYEFPDSSDYTIGIIVEPCKGNSYDCCHRFYGSPEYPMLIEPDDSSYRVVDKYRFADETEVLSNTVIVDKEGTVVPTANSRFADDEIVIDDNCTAAGVPEELSCVGFRQRMQRCGNVARCVDNNQTIDGAGSCQTLTGETSEHCIAVGYSQTAISVVCGGDYAEDDHCGTFLELHMGYANFYVDTEDVLSEVRLLTENVTGYTTTTMPTNWMNDSTRVLCAFEHASLLVGTMVLVSEDAPVCCCPRAFSQKDQLGSLVCPVYSSLEGPYAAALKTMADKVAFEEELRTYPFCPTLEDDEDLMVVSEYSSAWKRFYTREAALVGWDNTTTSYTSDDLASTYDATCEYLPHCALATGGSCGDNDRKYTFAGRVGKITSVPDDSEDAQYGVSFNDGRTSYYFNEEHLQVEQDYNYEIWWVQRTLHNFRVQARKPLTVTSPTCTFDGTNGQYYPYTMLDEDGVGID